jgi:hypothetical protein
MPEREIEELAKTTGHSSFEVFARWLKDNRESLEGAIAKQGTRMEEIRGEILVKLEAFVGEQQKTNGRLTALERERELAAAVIKERARWEGEVEAKALKAQAARDAQEEKKWRTQSLVITSFCTLVGGGVLGYVGHAIGAW